jgi:acetyl-CoA carboxylase biotin carboxyl carrier protein
VKLKSKIDNIIEALKDTNISEIEISSFWGAQKIKLKTSLYNRNLNDNKDKKDDTSVNNQKTDLATGDSAITDFSENSSKVVNEEIINNEDHTVIKAPLVGTFYASSKPGDPAFVEKGRIIKVGDPLCIVEAMKIFNTIESEYSGKMIDILVQDGDPVEFGQDLFLIKEINV